MSSPFTIARDSRIDAMPDVLIPDIARLVAEYAESTFGEKIDAYFANDTQLTVWRHGGVFHVIRWRSRDMFQLSYSGNHDWCLDMHGRLPSRAGFIKWMVSGGSVIKGPGDHAQEDFEIRRAIYKKLCEYDAIELGVYHQ